MRACSVQVIILVLGFGVEPAMAGPSWIEPPCPGGDAGSNGGSSQQAGGTGPLGSISGNLCGEEMNLTAASGDYEDVFMIRICNSATFSAYTSASFNAQLWLFAADGHGLLGNDDSGLSTHESAISPPANDGTGQTIPGPGVYLIAISGSGNDPLTAGDSIFDQSSAIEISGPDGSGGLGELDGWSALGETGEYTIFLTGAALLADDCSDPRFTGGASIPAVSEWGVAILVLAVLSGGTIMLSRHRGATGG